MFADKFKVAQHRDHKQFADGAYYGLYDENKTQNWIESISNKTSELNMGLASNNSWFSHSFFWNVCKHQFYIFVTHVSKDFHV